MGIHVRMTIDGKNYEGTLEPSSSSGNERPKHRGRESSRMPSKRLVSLTDRIRYLIEEGFFDEPQGISEIHAQLKDNGWHHEKDRILMQLLRAVRPPRKILRRISEGPAGKRKIYKYVKD